MGANSAISPHCFPKEIQKQKKVYGELVMKKIFL
jgi:hypothetical protein